MVDSTHSTKLRAANRALRAGDYLVAIGLYREIQYDVSPLKHIVDFNINFALRRIESNRGPYPANTVIRLNSVRQAGHSEYERVCILIVAHDAGERLFGGERSFLDLLGAIDRSRYKVVAALPTPHPNYLRAVTPLVDSVETTPRVWWNAKKALNESLIQQFQKIIQKYQTKLVYANTIMLRESLIAADRERVRSVCHVREAIDRDEALVSLIGQDATSIIEAVKMRSEYLIANSRLTQSLFFKANSVFRVYNAVDVDKFDLAQLRPESGPFRVGMLSSNLLKKGISDFAVLAKAAKNALSRAVFVFYGPETSALQELRKRIAEQGEGDNIEFAGYEEDAAKAVSSLHVVVNFSHFAESFGRTVAEAMAARRPVVAYDYGALPELVVSGETGFLVEYQNPIAALQPLKLLADDPKLYVAMGDVARRRACQLFSSEAMRRDLNGALAAILTAEPAPASGVPRSLEAPRVSVVIPNYNYARYLPERIGSILSQTRQPDEIIFLDDASSDNSVEVAHELLRASNIPYRVVANETNRGIYAQWLKGLGQSSGDWVWIAEADDRSEPDFLESLLRRIEEGVSLVYSQSRRIDAEGAETAPHNRGHTDALSTERWKNDYIVAGRDEIALGLGFRNTIPNVSATLIRRSAVKGVEVDLARLSACGDWLLYAYLARHGRIAYVARSLNHFRRHPQSTTRQQGSSQSYLEELAVVHGFIGQAFALLPREVDRFADFVDRDYKIRGIARNGDYPVLAAVLAQTRASAEGRVRVGFITTNNGSWNGGSEVLWRDAAVRLSSQGHDVLALVRRWAPRPPFEEDFATAGVRVLYKQENGFEHLLALEPDLVVVSTGDQDEGVEYFPALEKRSIPFAIVNQLTKDPRFWKLREERTPGLQTAYRSARLALFASRNNLRLMEVRLGFHLEQGGVHFNPFHIDPNEPPPMPSTANGLRIAVPAKLLFVHKGQDLLVPVFAESRWKERHVEVHFYGEGPDGTALADRATAAGVTCFRFHGRIPDVGDIWRNCHAILMPSRMEGMPIVLISAMVAGRVPIVTDIGGATEVVKDGESGFVATDPDPVAIQEALERAWAVRDLWPEIGARARQAALAYLPTDPVGDFVERLLRAVNSLDTVRGGVG